MNLLLLITTMYLIMALESSADSTPDIPKIPQKVVDLTQKINNTITSTFTKIMQNISITMNSEDILKKIPAKTDQDKNDVRKALKDLSNTINSVVNNSLISVRQDINNTVLNALVDSTRNNANRTVTITYVRQNTFDSNIENDFNLNNLNVNIMERNDYSYRTTGAYKFHTIAATWDDAREICHDEGGDLAVIDTYEEEQILLKMFKKYQSNVRYARFINLAYIGVHKLFPSGNWVTIHGDSLNANRSYKEWIISKWDTTTQHCATLNDAGGMRAATCRFKYAFFCELRVCRCNP